MHQTKFRARQRTDERRPPPQLAGARRASNSQRRARLPRAYRCRLSRAAGVTLVGAVTAYLAASLPLTLGLGLRVRLLSSTLTPLMQLAAHPAKHPRSDSRSTWPTPTSSGWISSRRYRRQHPATTRLHAYRTRDQPRSDHRFARNGALPSIVRYRLRAADLSQPLARRRRTRSRRAVATGERFRPPVSESAESSDTPYSRWVE